MGTLLFAVSAIGLTASVLLLPPVPESTVNAFTVPLVATPPLVVAAGFAFLGRGTHRHVPRAPDGVSPERREADELSSDDRGAAVAAAVVITLLVPFAIAGSSLAAATVAGLFGGLVGFGLAHFAVRTRRWGKPIARLLVLVWVFGISLCSVLVISDEWKGTVYFFFAFGFVLGLGNRIPRKLRNNGRNEN